MQVNKNAFSLLRSKLYRPPVVANHLRRQRLLDHLTLYRERPLTLVSAPAGYGKSMLVSYWLETCGIPGGWLSLDDNDNDLRSFITYFTAAVERLFPGSFHKTKIMINNPIFPQWKNLISTLLNELDQIEETFILVLDDYHHIRETMIHDLLNELLNHVPQSLHLVINSRQDPFLPISMLRARNLVTEVRARDLRLNQSEAEELLRLMFHHPIDSHTTKTLRVKTEGWITGLILAAISMRHRENPDSLLPELHSEGQYVMEYLFNEVYEKQSPKMKQYLLTSAVLDRFFAPLCEAVCMPGAEAASIELGGWEYITRLKQANLFLIPLDPDNHWFRFHHLFRRLLLNQLKRCYSSEKISAIHARASAWFSDNSMIEEAIQHALAASDVNGAAQLIVQNRHSAVNAERWFELEKWLSLLPDDIVQKHPELLLAQAWIYVYHYDYGLIPVVLELAESLLSTYPNRQALSGEINLFKGITLFFQGDSELSLKCLEDARVKIPATQDYTRAAADQFWALTGHMQGQEERVVAELTDLLQTGWLGDIRKIRVMAILVTEHILSGDLTVAFNMGKQLKKIAIRTNSNYYIICSLYFLGLIHFCRNELDQSIDHLSQAAELGCIIFSRANADYLGALALAYQAKQLTEEADASMERLDEYIQSLNNPVFLEIAHSFLSRLTLMKGKVPATTGVSIEKRQPNNSPMLFWLETPDITLCRGLIAAGSDMDLKKAEHTLKEYHRLCRTQHNTFQMIFILPLLSIVYERQGRLDEALRVMEKAVNLGCRGGFIRPFLESGPVIAGLLKKLADKNIAVEYIGQILTAFSQPASPSSPDPQKRESLLTNREIDVLEMLVQRLQNKEIAEKLSISSHTVNTHLKSIYSKLNANNRRQAVVRAREFDIF